MAKREHVEQLKQGVEAWNKWRDENTGIRPDLSGADLSGADLVRADLVRANLIKANLRNANLIEANLRSANLRSARLSSAYLSGADLSGADLSDATLSEAILTGAQLNFANLSGAHLGGTNFVDNDLRTVKGLSIIKHYGKSYIELFSVQLPQDGSALHFLRGCGVPDEWIDDYRARMMHPIQYHSCFISYSSKDELIASRLHADLQAQGVRCWFASEDMKIGDRIRQRIDEAIHIHEKVLLLLSEHSVASAWVADEVEAAFEKERRQERDILFPVRLDESVMQTNRAWAAKLRRERNIGDFSQWENSAKAYETAFKRLLRDLKQE